MSDHLHYIEHRHEASYGVKTTFTCKGDRNSPCHQYPDCECDSYGEDHEHANVPHDECIWERWAAHADCETLCGPDDAPVRGGPEPVRVWFEECMVWEYINNETKRDTVTEKRWW